MNDDLIFFATLSISGIEKIQLLENISRLGSISDAAKAMGISYRSAWDSIQLMNSSPYGPLILTSPGGKRGGSTTLTPTAEKILLAYQMVSNEHSQFMKKVNYLNKNINNWEHLFRRASIKTSARNQFSGKVQKIKKGAINSEVEVLLNGGDILVSTITNQSLEDLAIKKNSEVWAIFKATWVILGTDEKMALSTGNQLKGVISQITKGAVNSEVLVKLTGGNEVVSIVTNESSKNLKLKKGMKVSAYINASHIILGVNN